MKVLIFDIETAPIEAYVWGLYDQNIAINQIIQDWTVLSYSAKWLGKDKILYQDQRYAQNIRNDRKLLKGIWRLLDEADMVVTQNGKAFDVKKLNARFVIQGMKPPSSFKHADTKVIAKKFMAFTSNRLEYLSKTINEKYTKLLHKKYPGQELWNECLKGNLKAWKEMEKYNKHDVLALEELYKKLIAWDSSLNYMFCEGDLRCSCGSTSFRKRGFFFSPTGKFQRYRCKKCGAETRSRVNLLKKKDRKARRVGVPR